MPLTRSPNVAIYSSIISSRRTASVTIVAASASSTPATARLASAHTFLIHIHHWMSASQVNAIANRLPTAVLALPVELTVTCRSEAAATAVAEQSAMAV